MKKQFLLYGSFLCSTLMFADLSAMIEIIKTKDYGQTKGESPFVDEICAHITAVSLDDPKFKDWLNTSFLTDLTTIVGNWKEKSENATSKIEEVVGNVIEKLRSFELEGIPDAPAQAPNYDFDGSGSEDDNKKEEGYNVRSNSKNTEIRNAKEKIDEALKYVARHGSLVCVPDTAALVWRILIALDYVGYYQLGDEAARLTFESVRDAIDQWTKERTTTLRDSDSWPPLLMNQYKIRKTVFDKLSPLIKTDTVPLLREAMMLKPEPHYTLTGIEFY